MRNFRFYPTFHPHVSHLWVGCPEIAIALPPWILHRDGPNPKLNEELVS